MTPDITIEQFAENELNRMNIAYSALSLIRDKDGVSVWRVSAESGSVVMKCFAEPEFRREIANYRLLNDLGVPTLTVIARTDRAIVIEDIERSRYRLATEDDVSNPLIAAKIAVWYKTLHQNGREYLKTHDFIDEYDDLTLANMRLTREKTGTGDCPVWQVIEERFERIRSAIMSLPRTLVYTDFHYTNLAVGRESPDALIFDYNFFFKSYAYSDLRNVCGSLTNPEAKAAFLSAYGAFDEHEVIVDRAASVLIALIIACKRKNFPNWAKPLLDQVKDGRLLLAVEKLLEVAE